MTQTSKTVVFFGSGPVAAESLRLLVKHTQVEAVITKPRPSHHRGSVPVLEACEELGLKVFTPANRSELTELFATKPVNSEVGIVIDYGIIIDQAVIDFFPLGIVNSHFSLLPQWRGADPITFSILSGQKTTGVSLMLIVQKMDEGPLLAQAEYEMPADVTTPQLTHDLIELSDSMLAEILPQYVAGKVRAAPQEAVTIADDPTPTYSRKLTKDDGLLDWHKPAEVLEREVRAYIEWPKSRTELAGREVVLTQANVAHQQLEPGTALVEGKQLFVGCGVDSLEIIKVKPAGKAEMTAEAFLAGYKQYLA